MIEKIIEIISNIIEYLRNCQLINAGKNKVVLDNLEQEIKTNEKINEIKNDVNSLNDCDIERLLNIKINNK